MTNHYHLLVETGEPTLAEGMHWLNGRYARDFNWKYGFRGHLFERRYEAVVVEQHEHILEVARYIVLNPVRAGICTHARAWPWSSFAAMTGRAHVPTLLTTAWLHDIFGPDRKTAIRRFEAFVADGADRELSGAWHRTRPDQPNPYVPGKRSAKSRTRSAAGRPTTLR
jgi:putative transposase